MGRLWATPGPETRKSLELPVWPMNERNRLLEP